MLVLLIIQISKPTLLQPISNNFLPGLQNKNLVYESQVFILLRYELPF